MLNSVPGLMSYFLHSLGRWPLTRPICLPTTGLRIPNHARSEWNEMRDTYLGMFSHISLSIECYFVLIRIFFTFDFIGLVSIDLKYSENDWLMICCHSFYRMWANKCMRFKKNELHNRALFLQPQPLKDIQQWESCSGDTQLFVIYIKLLTSTILNRIASKHWLLLGVGDTAHTS